MGRFNPGVDGLGWLPIASSGSSAGSLVAEHGAVDGVGESPLEGSAGFCRSFSFRDFALVVGAARTWVAALPDRDGVQRSVELSVSAGVEAVAGLFAAGGV